MPEADDTNSAIPLSHSSAHGKVVRNFLALGSGEAISRLIAFAATLYLARVLGPEGYGTIALAIGVNLYLAKVAEFGIDAAGAKEIADAPDRVPEIASAVITARLIITTPMVLVFGAMVLWLVPEPEGSVLALYFLTLIPIAASTKWIHIGLQRAEPVGVARVLAELVALGLILLVVRGVGDLRLVPLAQGVGELLSAIVLYLVLVRRSHGFGLRWNLRVAKPILARGLPLAVQILLGLVIYNSDLVFLRVFQGAAAVGFYAAAYTLISFAANLGMTYGISLLPALTRVRNDPADGGNLYRTGLVQIAAVSIPIAVGAFFLAPKIIHLGFGAGWGPSTLALQILAVSIPFSAIRNIPWVALVAMGRGHLLTRVMVGGVVANLALNAALVPSYGLFGAGVATVLTEVLVCVLMLRTVRREGLMPPSTTRLVKPLVASAAMGLALWSAGSLSLFVAFGIGCVVFVVVLTALGGIRFRSGKLPTLEV